MHLTSLYLLDIISSLVARRFELAGVDRAPERPAVPGVPEPPASCSQDEVDEETLLRRTAASPPPSLPLGRASHRADLPVGESCAYVESETTYRFDFIYFYFFFGVSSQRVVGPARWQPGTRPSSVLHLQPVSCQ
jgi:hypothetical protein